MPDNELKALIRKTETGKTGSAEQYNTIIGHNEKHLAKLVTQMTVDEIIAASDGWRQRFGTTSGAAGAYQIIKPTLIALKVQIGLRGDEEFTPALQDRLCDQLLAKRGYNQFIVGTSSVETFGNSLAREWASFPCLAPQLRGSVKLKRGQSYYDKFAGNSALIKPETVEATLLMLRAPAPAALPDAPLPVTPTYLPGDTDEPSPIASGLGFVDVLIGVIVVLGLLVAAYLFWPH